VQGERRRDFQRHHPSPITQPGSTQWRHLAKSYEFVASLERFLIDVQRNALPNNEENLPRNPDI
jgi:hypothetical protein